MVEQQPHSIKMFWIKIRRFLALNYFTLYYYQEIIDQYLIYYDRNRYRRLFQYVDKYLLLSYRKVAGPEYALRRPANYPTKINSSPVHLLFIRLLMLFQVVRCFSIAFIRPVANTEAKRIYLGTELFKADYFFMEVTFLFWSSISYLYLQFSFSDSPLDYKFLALFRMSEQNTNYLSPVRFGLSSVDFKKFKQFRTLALAFYNATMSSISTFGPCCIIFLNLSASLYSSHPLATFTWTIIENYWIYVVCTVIYGNLTAFIVVAKYLNIKQKSLAVSVETLFIQLLYSKRVNRLQSVVLMGKFMTANTHYSHLYNEMLDYHSFWVVFVSVIFVFYVLLISFIIYIAIFSTIATYVKGIYCLIFYFHVVLLSAIIYYTGGMVQRNGRLAVKFTSTLGRFVENKKGVPVATVNVFQTLKMSNLSMYYTQMNENGFKLINGYLITTDTFRLIIVNITVYFLLILKY